MRKKLFVSLALFILTLSAMAMVVPGQAQQEGEADEEMSFFDRQCLDVLKAIVIKKLPRNLYMANMDTFFFGLRGAEIDRFRMTENNNFYRSLISSRFFCIPDTFWYTLTRCRFFSAGCWSRI